MFDWIAQDGGFRCQIGDVTLVATPDRYVNGKAARGSKWHAQATHWNERTRTASRFGRDEYLNVQDCPQSAMKLAEDIFKLASG